MCVCCSIWWLCRESTELCFCSVLRPLFSLVFHRLLRNIIKSTHNPHNDRLLFMDLTCTLCTFLSRLQLQTKQKPKPSGLKKPCVAFRVLLKSFSHLCEAWMLKEAAEVHTFGSDDEVTDSCFIHSSTLTLIWAEASPSSQRARTRFILDLIWRDRTSSVHCITYVHWTRLDLCPEARLMSGSKGAPVKSRLKNPRWHKHLNTLTPAAPSIWTFSVSIFYQARGLTPMTDWFCMCDTGVSAEHVIHLDRNPSSKPWIMWDLQHESLPLTLCPPSPPLHCGSWCRCHLFDYAQYGNHSSWSSLATTKVATSSPDHNAKSNLSNSLLCALIQSNHQTQVWTT